MTKMLQLSLLACLAFMAWTLPVAAQLPFDVTIDSGSSRGPQPQVGEYPTGFELGELVIETVSSSRVIFVLDREAADGWADKVIIWESEEHMPDAISMQGRALLRLNRDELLIRMLDSDQVLRLTVGDRTDDTHFETESAAVHEFPKGRSLESLSPRTPTSLRVKDALAAERERSQESLLKSVTAPTARQQPEWDYGDGGGDCQYDSCLIACPYGACNIDCTNTGGCASCECSVTTGAICRCSATFP